tara:strand:- start:1860 stop:2246 length:387 start_codon:yes stop_codon:yes gene_type:complete
MKRLAIMLCLAGDPLFGQTASGNEIAAACEEIGAADVKTGYCIGYIIGAWEGMKIGAFHMLAAGGVNGTSAELDEMVNNLLGICMPEAVERGQIVDLSRDYFSNNPAERHLPARGLIRDALAEAFPCE